MSTTTLVEGRPLSFVISHSYATSFLIGWPVSVAAAACPPAASPPASFPSPPSPPSPPPPAPQLQELICRAQEYFGFDPDRFISLVVCNADALTCPRQTTFAQNGGCNSRPFFGEGIIGREEEGEEVPEYIFQFGEDGFSIEFSMAFVGPALMKIFCGMRSKGSKTVAPSRKDSTMGKDKGGKCSSAVGDWVPEGAINFGLGAASLGAKAAEAAAGVMNTVDATTKTDIGANDNAGEALINDNTCGLKNGNQGECEGASTTPGASFPAGSCKYTAPVDDAPAGTKGTCKADPSKVSKTASLAADGKGVKGTVVAAAVLNNLDALIDVLTDFKFTITLKKERDTASGKGGKGAWAFSIAMPGLRDVDSVWQLVALKLGPDWHKIINLSGGKFCFLGSLCFGLPIQIKTSDDQDATFRAAWTALWQVLKAGFSREKPSGEDWCKGVLQKRKSRLNSKAGQKAKAEGAKKGHGKQVDTGAKPGTVAANKAALENKLKPRPGMNQGGADAKKVIPSGNTAAKTAQLKAAGLKTGPQ